MRDSMVFLYWTVVVSPDLRMLNVKRLYLPLKKEGLRGL
jgi:hypothetical protein